MTMGRASTGRYPLASVPVGPFGKALHIDCPVPFEIGGTKIVRDAPMPLAFVLHLARDAPIPVSWTAGLILNSDNMMPLTWVARVALDASVPLAFLQGIVLSLDNYMPVTWAGGVVKDSPLPLSFLGTPFIGGEVIRPATPMIVLVPQRPRGM